jgi:hypothetical protein
MLRGFITTVSVVSILFAGAFLLSDQYRMAEATSVAQMTPAATSMTTNSNFAAKGDQLPRGVQLSAVTGEAADAVARIVETHARAMQANASGTFLTVGTRSGAAETTLTRVRTK